MTTPRTRTQTAQDQTAGKLTALTLSMSADRVIIRNDEVKETSSAVQAKALEQASVAFIAAMPSKGRVDLERLKSAFKGKMTFVLPGTESESSLLGVTLEVPYILEYMAGGIKSQKHVTARGHYILDVATRTLSAVETADMRLLVTHLALRRNLEQGWTNVERVIAGEVRENGNGYKVTKTQWALLLEVDARKLQARALEHAVDLAQFGAWMLTGKFPFEPIKPEIVSLESALLENVGKAPELVA